MKMSKVTEDAIRLVTETGCVFRYNYSPCDFLAELGARLCYRSLDRFGTKPTFPHDVVVRRGHSDVAEHGVVFFGSDLDMTRYSKYVQVASDGAYGASVRALLDMMARLPVHAVFDIRDILVGVAPRTMGRDYGATWRECILEGDHARSLPHLRLAVHPDGSYYEVSGPRVVLVSLAVHDDLWHAGFVLEGVSRSLTHQLVRHRLLSFSQESMRYVDMAKESGLEVVVPESSVRGESFNRFIESVHTSVRTYATLRENGVRKEDARFVLPIATSSRIMVSGWQDGWQHFFKLRCASDAQWEIRDAATAMRDILVDATGIDV